MFAASLNHHKHVLGLHTTNKKATVRVYSEKGRVLTLHTDPRSTIERERAVVSQELGIPLDRILLTTEAGDALEDQQAIGDLLHLEHVRQSFFGGEKVELEVKVHLEFRPWETVLDASILKKGLPHHQDYVTDARTSFALPNQAYRIEGTEHRGITLSQLRHTIFCAGAFCSKWYDNAPAKYSRTAGQTLSLGILNLYHINTWLLLPSTEASADEEDCAFVELLADRMQTPEWFISHWWGECVLEFYKSALRHAETRNLTDATAYWVCAYANRQHSLSKELTADPRQTSFFKAMQLALGVLLILDDETALSDGATAFTRIWCGFEEFVAVTHDGRDTPLLFDICAVHQGTAQLLTDGLTNLEQAMVPMLGHRVKSLREDNFPVGVLEKAMNIRIQNAQASMEADRRHILNTIAGSATLDQQPPANHPQYDVVNHSLEATFAFRCWRSLLDVQYVQCAQNVQYVQILR